MSIKFHYYIDIIVALGKAWLPIVTNTAYHIYYKQLFVAHINRRDLHQRILRVIFRIEYQEVGVTPLGNTQKVP